MTLLSFGQVDLPLKEGFYYHSPLLATYFGTGTLSTPTGALRCNFRADQEFNGGLHLVLSRIDPRDLVFHVIALFDIPKKVAFRGKTGDGSSLSIELFGPGRPLSPDTQGYSAIYFEPEQLTICSKTGGPPHPEFLLTNFAFTPFTHLGEPPALPPPHTLELTIPPSDHRHIIKVQPLPDYVSRIVALWQSKHVLPTAQMVLHSDPCTSPDLFKMAKKICWLLSVASGTVVQWISMDAYDQEKNLRIRHHAARRTGPFCSMPMLPFREFAYAHNTTILQAFLQHGLDRLGQTDAEEVTRLVAAVLDARTEGNFFEARGIKTVVVLEMLKNLYVERYCTSHWDLVMPKSLRKRIEKLAVDALRANDVAEEAISVVRGNLANLGHPHFKKLLLFMLNELALVEEDIGVKRAVETRNSLVHYGKFVSTRDPKKGKGLGILDAANELFILTSFVDKLLLRVLGYSGLYFDYSRSRAFTLTPVIRDLPIRRMRQTDSSSLKPNAVDMGRREAIEH